MAIEFIKGLLRKIDGFTESLLSKQLSGIGFGLFRISFFSVLFIEALQILAYIDIIFLHHASAYFAIICIWAIAIIFLAVGYQTRIASFVNFAIIVGVLSRFSDFEYHIDYIYMGISFICLWVPLENRFALSNLLHKRSPRTVPRAYYLLFVAIGLGSIYLESCFHKLDSRMWVTGLGFWLPSSLPQFNSANWDYILNNKMFVQFLGFFTFAFEFLFILFVWFKWGRLFLLIGGVGLHLGILIAYPIPLFGIAMAVQYLLLVPDSWFVRIRRWSPESYFQFSRSDSKIFLGISLLAILMQILAFLSIPQISRVKDSLILNQMNAWALKTQYFRTILFGMASHTMFVDQHFATKGIFDYQVDAVLTKSNGVVVKKTNIFKPYQSGRIWVNWMFRVGGREPFDPLFQSQLQRYLQHWNSQLSLEDIVSREYSIRRRPFEVEEISWKKDFYLDRLNAPFQEVARIRDNFDNTFSWELVSVP